MSGREARGDEPGRWLRVVARLLVGDAITERVFDPLLADAQAEHREAGSPAEARRARLRGTLAFLNALALTAPAALLAPPRRAALAAMALGSLGVATVGAADIHERFPRLHGQFLALGVALMVAAASLPRRWWTRPPPLAWALAGAAALLSPHLEPSTGDGVARWVHLGALRIQPGELCKPLLVLALAGQLAPEGGARPTRPWVGALGLGALFVLPALSQPDVGLALVMVAMVAAAVWASDGRRAWPALAGCALASGGLLLALRPVWACWPMPGALLADAAARGGLTGSHGGSLAPVTTRHTDFVLAVTAQRAGLLGLAVVLGLVLLVAREALSLAGRAGTPTARVAAASVASGLVTQTALHAAGACGLVPLTGVALPGVSFGGSALVGMLVSMGLVLGLSRAPRALRAG